MKHSSKPKIDIYSQNKCKTLIILRNPFTEAYKQRRMQLRNDFTAFSQSQN